MYFPPSSSNSAPPWWSPLLSHCARGKWPQCATQRRRAGPHRAGPPRARRVLFARAPPRTSEHRLRFCTRLFIRERFLLNLGLFEFYIFYPDILQKNFEEFDQSDFNNNNILPIHASRQKENREQRYTHPHTENLTKLFVKKAVDFTKIQKYTASKFHRWVYVPEFIDADRWRITYQWKTKKEKTSEKGKKPKTRKWSAASKGYAAFWKSQKKKQVKFHTFFLRGCNFTKKLS